MTALELASAVLLAAGVLVVLACAVGTLALGNVYDRLHFLGPAGTLGPATIALAVVLREGFSAAGLKALLVAALLMVGNVLLTHATARAARLRARRPDPEEAP